MDKFTWAATRIVSTFLCDGDTLGSSTRARIVENYKGFLVNVSKINQRLFKFANVLWGSCLLMK